MDFLTPKFVDIAVGAVGGGGLAAVLNFLINRRKGRVEEHTARANDVNKQRELLSSDEKVFRETMIKMWEDARRQAEEAERSHNETQKLLLNAQRERDRFAVRLEVLETFLRDHGYAIDRPLTIAQEINDDAASS